MFLFAVYFSELGLFEPLGLKLSLPYLVPLCSPCFVLVLLHPSLCRTLCSCRSCFIQQNMLLVSYTCYAVEVYIHACDKCISLYMCVACHCYCLLVVSSEIELKSFVFPKFDFMLFYYISVLVKMFVSSSPFVC